MFLLNNIKIKFKNKVYQTFTVIDRKLIWYGNINVLGNSSSEDGIIRVESSEIANEFFKSERRVLGNAF